MIGEMLDELLLDDQCVGYSLSTPTPLIHLKDSQEKQSSHLSSLLSAEVDRMLLLIPQALGSLKFGLADDRLDKFEEDFKSVCTGSSSTGVRECRILG